nr:unnamed protein product [Callosobruchus chinensis]
MWFFLRLLCIYVAGVKSHDIGLIKLPHAAPISEAINIVQLPPRSFKISDAKGKDLTIIGWGVVTGHREEVMSSPKLMQGVTHLIENSQCIESFPFIGPTNFCISGKRRDKSCMGDSGGPVLLDEYQIGIISYGHTYCDIGMPAVCVNIVDYLEWIESVTGERFDSS